jgi:tRNA (guanine37-N1)-methyltransferase
MRRRAVLVPRGRGEAVRRALVDAGALALDLEILAEGDQLALPLREDAEPRPEWGALGEREFPELPAPVRTEFRDLLDWPEEAKALLPRSFDVVGDIVLIRLPVELEERRFEIGEALRRFVPGSRLVGLDRGVEGAERLRQVERIAGAGGWETRHRENHLEFDVDVRRAYFSPRLAREHALVADEVRDGERVYDLCCGVGPFSVTIARDGRAASVTAVDANPAAIELLGRTLARYPFGGRVRPRVATLEEFAPRATPVERVIVNLPREGIKYATLVAPLVAPRGSLQYYEVVPRDEVAQRGNVVERALSSLAPFRVRAVRLVHPYSPSRDLIGLTAERGSS